MTRRRFLSATAATAAWTRVSWAQDPFDSLIQGQYANRLRFVRQAGGQYLGDRFKLSATPTEWLLKLGRYAGRYRGQAVDLRAYWIFKPNANVCWQAINRGGGALQYWNQDGRAVGNPEDWELFTFDVVNKGQKTVKIYNASFAAYAKAIGTWQKDQTKVRCYVDLVGDTFSCKGNVSEAAVFSVEF